MGDFRLDVDDEGGVLMGRVERNALGATVLVMCAMGLAACGGAAHGAAHSTPDRATAGATEAGSNDAAGATPTTSGSETTGPPASPFESDPRVEAIRAYAVEYGKAVNARKAHYGPWIATVTGFARSHATRSIEGDLDLKVRYPGPLPLKPLGFSSGDTVKVCVWAEGWGVKGRAHTPPQAKKVEPTLWKTVKVHGKWKVADITVSTSFDCTGVQVQGRPW